jgi:hypothetical protein
MLFTIHNRECDAYTLIKDVKEVPKPEVYYLEYRTESQPGVIVMEYLDKATTIGMYRSVTVQQCLNMARHLGTLQVLFWIYWSVFVFEFDKCEICNAEKIFWIF